MPSSPMRADEHLFCGICANAVQFARDVAGGENPVKVLFVLLAASLALILTGCAGEGDPAKAVESYLQAVVQSDADAMRGLTCAALEAQVQDRASSFAAVDASLDGLSCARSGADGSYTLVTCQGAIVIDYGAENSRIPLGTYRAIREDGDWKMCGEG